MKVSAHLRLVRSPYGARGLLSVGLLVLVVACQQARLVLAAPPEIRFADEKALKPDADALAAGIRVSICNSTSERQTVHFYLQQFAFTVEAGPIVTDSVIVVDPMLEVGPGICDDVSLRWANPAGPPALKDVSYTGSILAVSNGGGSARLEVSIPGASPIGKATGVLEPLDLHGSYGFFGSSGDVDLQSRTLLLRYKGDVAPVIARGELLAVVGHRSDLAEIKATRESQVVNGEAKVVAVPVEVIGAGGNGKFVGEVSRSLLGEEDKPVALTVTIRDGIGLLLLWTALGLIAGFLLKLVSGRYLPWLRIRTFRRAIDREYSKALEAFRGETPTFEARFVLGSSDEWKGQVGEATRRYKSSTLLFDKANAALKAILDDLAAARADAALLGNRGDGGFHKSLTDLRSTLRDLVKARRKAFSTAPRAVVELQAHRLLGGGPAPVTIPVGGAGKVRQEAKEVTALLKSWVGWADDHYRYRRWIVVLRERIGGPDDVQRQHDLATLDHLDDRLREILFELLDGREAAEFKAMGVESELRLVYTVLAGLAGRYGVYFTEHLQVEAPEYAAAQYVDHGMARLSNEGFEAADLDVDEPDAVNLPTALSGLVPWFGVSPATVRQMAEVAAGAGIVVLEIVIAVSALALTTAAVLMPLYVDRPFGAPSDYLKVFIAGATAQLLVTGLFNVARAWRDPSAAAET